MSCPAPNWDCVEFKPIIKKTCCIETKCFFSDGKFAAVGMNSEIKDDYMDKCEQVYDATNQTIIPGRK